MSDRLFMFITANKNEQNAFLSKLEDQKEKTFEHGIVGTYGKFGKYLAVHFHSPYQGNEAITSIANAIKALKPDAVILVGIACGANVKNQDQEYGDVLISKNIIDYDVHKTNINGIELRGAIVPSGDILYSLFNQRAYKWEIDQGQKFDNVVSSHFGDIISSAVLINDVKEKNKIFALYSNHPIGYEMEGIGAFRVCRNNNIHQWIVVKGISDFGDGKKNDNYQIIAAKNAVSLCHYVFSCDGLDDIPKVFKNTASYDKENSQIQLNEWKTRNVKLYNVLHENGEHIPIKLKDNNNNEYCIDDFISKLEEKDIHHAILTGEGGMGKTTICMHIGDIYLNKEKQVIYIPLCDYDSETTIKKSIMAAYGAKTDDEYELLIDEENIVLLLDGFNEMRFEHNPAFFSELRKLLKKMGIQILITSRNDVIHVETTDFTKFTFEPIANEEIDKYLKKHLSDNGKSEISTELYNILSNPMLLKLYAVNIKEQKKIANTQHTVFLDNPITAGEIIWNFLEHQIIKSKNLQHEKDGLSMILFRYLLPYIAYQIESREKLHFTLIDLKKYIDEFEEYFKDNYSKFDDFIYYENTFKYFFTIENSPRYLLDLCVENFNIVNLRTVTGLNVRIYGFIHQYFMDVFSATHIKNQMTLLDKSVFTERVLPFHISQMLMELLQEHKYVTPSLLRKYMRCFKCDFSEDAQKGVLNCVRIIDYARNGDLSREDFSELDLRMCSLYGKNNSETDFSHSYISWNVFFPPCHVSFVSDVNYSYDSKYMVSASHDETIKIWESTTGRLVRTLKGSSARKSLADKFVSSLSGEPSFAWEYAMYTPDDKYIVAESSDAIMLWESTTGKRYDPLNKKQSGVKSVIFSPDGKYRIFITRNELMVWECKNDEDEFLYTLEVCSFDDYFNICELCLTYENKPRVNFSPDGCYITAALNNGTIEIWDSATGKSVRTLELPSDNVFSVDFTSDKTYTISVSSDSIRMWENKAASLIRSLLKNGEKMSSKCCSPDGKYVVSTSKDKIITIWEIITGRAVRTIKHSHDYMKIASYSPNGKIIWNNAFGRTIHYPEIYKDAMSSAIYLSAIYSPDGKNITSFDGDAIKIWDSATGSLVRSHEVYNEYVLSASYSPDGNYIVAALNDGTIRIWEIGTGSLVGILKGHSGVVHNVYFCSDSRHVVSISGDGTVKIWEWEHAKIIHSIVVDEFCKRNNDGIPYFSELKCEAAKYMWNHPHDNIFRIFLLYGRDDCYMMSYSFDGKYIITTYKKEDGHRKESLLYIMEHESGELVNRISVNVVENEYDNPSVTGFSCSPDNKYITTATSDGDIAIWEIASGNMVAPLSDPEKYTSGVVTGSVYSVSYSPDGKHIIAASLEGAVRIWDSENHEMVHKIDVHDGPVYSAYYNHDGSRIVSASKDGTIKIWDGENYGLVKTIYPFAYMNVLKANLKGIRHDNLTKDDISAIKQNGAILD